MLKKFDKNNGLSDPSENDSRRPRWTMSQENCSGSAHVFSKSVKMIDHAGDPSMRCGTMDGKCERWLSNENSLKMGLKPQVKQIIKDRNNSISCCKLLQSYQ